MTAFSVRSAPERALSAAQECEVLRGAVRGGVAPPGVRGRLAMLLNQHDAFDESIALLSAVAEGALSPEEQLLLASAYLARGDAGLALSAAKAAEGLSETAAERAAAMVAQGKALRRLRQEDAAGAVLHAALALDPANPEALNLLGREMMRRGDPVAVVALTDRLGAQGVAHAQLLATRALALASLGDGAAARALLGLDTFLDQQSIAPPPGWESIAAFNAALAAELLAHPSLRYERHGTASVQSWRIDSLVAGKGPLARVLVGMLIAAVQQRVDALVGIDHPWIGAAPREAMVRSWCVITEGAGYEQWHMHPFGWMSGVYYVDVPPEVAGGSTDEGCLAIGVADTLVPAEAAAKVGVHLVRPRPGMMTLFPSHCYHHTFAHHAAGKRICVAFDVEPC